MVLSGPAGHALPPGWRFRPDIEGLRALAILLVVAGHAGIPGFAGGFVGVDVFFVLSGFLITGLLVSERERAGRIDFTAFYARRFRRLLPALAVMLLVTSVLASHLLLPMHQTDQAIAAAAAGVWLSNLHFAFGAIEYFAPDASGNLFLHTWSLSVEEQFYLFWPLLLAVCLAGAGTRGRLSVALSVVFVLGLLACVVATSHSARLAFYLMPTRAWQFALGGLAWLATAGGGRHTAGICASAAQKLAARSGWLFALALAGLIMVLAAAVMLDEDSPYPGIRALLPSAGTAVLLIAGSLAPQLALVRALAWAPMQFLGRLSYGWYLWHWPVLVLAATVLDLAPLQHRVVLMVLALVLAWLSLVAVERPFRRLRMARPARVIVVALVVMAGLVWHALAWHERAAGKVAAGEGRTPVIEVPAIYGMDCDQWYHSAELRPCEFRHGAAIRTVIVMGDSIGLQWFPAWQGLAERHGWRLVVLTKSACPMVDEPIYYARIGRQYRECELWRQNAMAWIAAQGADMVVLGSSQSYAFSEQQWREGTSRMLDRLVPVAGHVVLMRPTPVLPFDGPACSVPRGALHTWLASPDRCRAPAGTLASRRVDAALDQAAASRDKVSVLDLNDLVCPQALCRAEQGGRLVYRDNQHLDARFVASVAADLAQRLPQALVAADGQDEARGR